MSTKSGLASRDFPSIYIYRDLADEGEGDSITIRIRDGITYLETRAVEEGRAVWIKMKREDMEALRDTLNEVLG